MNLELNESGENNKIFLTMEKIEEPFHERDVSALIRKLKGEGDASNLSMEWLAEYMAFDFYEDRSEDGSTWGTYFGPKWSEVNENGIAFESPSIKMVTVDMLDYWASRARQSKHPILKARYSALVWDFSKEITKKSADIEMAQIWIDSVIETAKKDCHKYESDVVQKLKIILGLAIGINDSNRIANAKEAMLSYEFKVEGDHERGLWGFSFDNLLMNKKVKLNCNEKDKILNSLEQRLDRVANFEDKNLFDPHAAEAAATRLAQYYRKHDKYEDMKRVLLKYGKAFEDISNGASGLLAIGWLQKVESIYRDFGLKNEADTLLNVIRERGSDAQKDMKSISATHEISHKDMENYVNAMLEGDMEVATARIAFHYIPKKDEVAEQIKDLAEKYPISFLFPATIQDHNGRTVAQVGSLEDDFDGHVIRQIAQNMQFSSIFLRKVIDKFITKFSITPDSAITELSKCPLFMNDKADIIKAALEAYFGRNHVVAIHLFIPQIEDAIRKLLELCGGTTYKRARNGGYHLKTFDEMLRDDFISKSLGEDASLYFQILYTDPRGWNIRNDVCHGISLPNQFCIPVTDRIFHTLLLLSQVRERKTGSPPARG
jgi:hypothetical protein